MQRPFTRTVQIVAAAAVAGAFTFGLASAQQAATLPQQAAKLETKTQQPFGAYLADGKGMSVYMFEKDTKGQSNCYDACAQAWPPVLTKGQPEAGDKVDKSKLGTITRKDGATQVTYEGMPLYYYKTDSNAGDVKGQDVNGFGAEWYLVSPEGEPIKTEATKKTQ